MNIHSHIPHQCAIILFALNVYTICFISHINRRARACGLRGLMSPWLLSPRPFYARQLIRDELEFLSAKELLPITAENFGFFASTAFLLALSTRANFFFSDCAVYNYNRTTVGRN